jgi:hypothetical protein
MGLAAQPHERQSRLPGIPLRFGVGIPPAMKRSLSRLSSLWLLKVYTGEDF